jgi:acyl carrier protein
MTTPDTTQTPQDIAATVSERIRVLFAEHITPWPDDAKFIAETRLIEDLGADSLDCVSLVIAVEDEFGIEVSDDQFATVVTVGDVIDLVKTQIAEAEKARRVEMGVAQ